MLQQPFGPVLDGTTGIEKLKLSKANYGNVYNLINYTVWQLVHVPAYLVRYDTAGIIR